MLHYSYEIAVPFYHRGNWLVVGVYGVLLFFFSHLYGSYRLGYYKRSNVIYSGSLALIICNGVTYLQTSLLGQGFMQIIPFIQMTVVQCLLVIVLTCIAHMIYMHLFSPRQLLMVYGGGNHADHLLSKLAAYPENFTIKNTVHIEMGYKYIGKKIVKHQGVVLCDIPAEARNELLKFCFERGIRTYTTPKISDVLIRGASDVTLFDIPLLLNRNQGLSVEQRIVKRFVDIIMALVGLVVALPVMLVTAFAIWIYDRGPVLYKQVRLTRNNRTFNLYKFRSMIINAEVDGAQLATENDPRVTPVGKILRAVRLDELPQLWNILKGDMSVVGPRPERPEIAGEYRQTMPEFEFRLRVKAGLTGLAQTEGLYSTTAYNKLMLDLAYIANYSLMQDFKLILKTVKILFMKGGAQGGS
ncbi:MAG: exopolysaccharide biosynthesis polyprenyl glycosylphosphotransferase [Defluviitaleaceae bacterium]|nr:exopolysaccharide biosynthesis polyprenyl glycosylphosphotransferase [Defluviitaleaceae bacterium]